MTGCTKTTTDNSPLLLLLGGGGTPPLEPAAPTATAGVSQIELGWTAVDGAIAYEVWYNETNDSATATQDGGDIAGTDHVLDGLDNGITYYVWLKAKNASGTSGFSAVASGMPAWTRLLGESNDTNTLGCAVAIDGDGNSFMTGYTTGLLDPDNTTTGNHNVYLAKYDKDAVKLWVEQPTGQDGKTTDGNGIAADPDGNIYVAGTTNGSVYDAVKIGTGTNTNAFIIKYDNDGTKIWATQAGVADKNTYCNGIAVDADGNSYITGYTNADLDGAGDGSLTGSYDVYVAKYDTDGTQLWVQQLGVASVGTYGRGIAVDPDGNCYITGQTEGGLGGNTKAGDPDVFVLKYNTAGTLQWVKQMGVAAGLKSTYGFGIAVDASGNSYVTGQTGGDLDGVGPGVLVGNPDVFVMKYNTSGTLQWLKQTSATGKYASGKGIALDTEGNCYVSGETNADLDGEGSGVLTGTKDTFVISYDTDGTSRMIKQMGTVGKNIFTYGIAATPGGACLVTGYVDADFDGQDYVGLFAAAFMTMRLNE